MINIIARETGLGTLLTLPSLSAPVQNQEQFRSSFEKGKASLGSNFTHLRN